MQKNFDVSLKAVLAHEGGFVNHRLDPGGATNLGVTIGTAKRLGIDVDGDGDTDITDIRLLKPSDAAKVYRTNYWNKVRADDLPSGVDYAVFDFAVNSGPTRAAIYLQEVLGVAPDGKIGPITLAAAANASPHVVVNALCAKRLAFVKRLSTWNTFGKGWSRRISGVRVMGLELASEAPKRRPAPDAPTKPSTPASDAPVARNWVSVLIGVIVGFLRGLGRK